MGWHWVLEMSKYFELWVLTRESNRHTIEPWVADHPEYATIHFVYYDLPRWARRWKKGLRGVRTYYNLWQTLTNGIVRRTMRENDIHIFHHLTYGNALWKVSAYGQRQFFVWGPVSAAAVTPKDFTRHYGTMSRMKEALQRLMRKTLPLNQGFIHRCRDAKLILCKTDDTIACVPEKYRHKCVQFTDVAVELKDTSRYNIVPTPTNKIRFLSAGSLVGWRNFDVLIDAFAMAVKQNFNISLTILGDGDERERLTSLIAERNMQQYITMGGQVSMEEYNRRMAECDVVVNPCFREGAVTVSFDSMSFGKPLICFDTGGYTHYFTEDYAKIIKGVQTREQATKRLAEEILSMTRRQQIAEMGAKARQAAGNYTWHKHGEEIRDVITKTYEHDEHS